MSAYHETSNRRAWFLKAHPAEVVEAYLEDGSLHEAIAREIESLQVRAASTRPVGHNVGTCGCMSCGMARAAIAQELETVKQNLRDCWQEIARLQRQSVDLFERATLAESTRDAAQAHASLRATQYQEIAQELSVQKRINESLRLEAEEGNAAILRRAEAAEADMRAMERKIADLQAAYDGDDRSRR